MSQHSTGSFPIIRKLLPYSSVAALLALIYMGWVFYARSNQNRELAQEADRKSAEQARKTYELYGSGQLKVLLFYAAPAVVPRAGTTQLCYSIANATTVKIDQGVEDIKPSLNHCLPVHPAKSTTYTITAADDKGRETAQSINVVVK